MTRHVPDAALLRRVAALEAENDRLRHVVETLRSDRQTAHDLVRQEVKRCSGV